MISTILRPWEILKLYTLGFYDIDVVKIELYTLIFVISFYHLKTMGYLLVSSISDTIYVIVAVSVK